MVDLNSKIITVTIKRLDISIKVNNFQFRFKNRKKSTIPVKNSYNVKYKATEIYIKIPA